MEENLHYQILQVKVRGLLLLAVFVCLGGLVLLSMPAGAITAIPTPKPMPGSFGIQATKPTTPPKVGAQITTPGGGSSFTTSPIDVSGICPKGLLVQVYDNNVMVGAVICNGGSFKVKVSLFSGTNNLSALVFDDLGQTGPKSNVVKVTYNNAHFTSFGSLITLTSDYGRLSAGVGSSLDWPLKLFGGNGPYAMSIDWGDGGSPELKSQASSGSLTISHVYTQAGIYNVNIKVTDQNGVSAFLQVVAIANGKTSQAPKLSGGTTGTPTQLPPKILWIPSLMALVLIPIAFWLGTRSELVSLRRKMTKERDSYEKK